MAQTVPNQKKIFIHRDYPKSDFLQISNTHWMEFNKKHGPYALQLYLYFAKNKDGYSFALSQEDAEKEIGIAKTTFHKYVNLMIEEGYLIQRRGNAYNFYETPHKQEQKEVRGSPCGELVSSQDEQENLPCERRSSMDEIETPPGNKEINNTYINNKIYDIKESLQQQEKQGRNTEETENKFSF